MKTFKNLKVDIKQDSLLSEMESLLILGGASRNTSINNRDCGDNNSCISNETCKGNFLVTIT